MNYHILREFADSWVLLGMFVFFFGVIVWAIRPGSNKEHRDVANSIFRNEDKPANSEEART
ncbi:cbb3-type cytochrome oxidase subunit 3 [Celeribacter marinus]|uniref:Cytochrome c oxidase subunit CcoQ n=1 Tax=Celeribacter marinus TaxID=1397108 RepID=A0A0P0AB49_9RHOB|nr:cbb3-type cytochrome c oxidase subunit 3 [Celeribacter marinus]ALI55191.1 cytochrome c oxidase subunit CcoQ [Celeribacter marinus]SFK09025.1 cytochrome c oxidase cbb3-type subunit 4 [Celeribacter marinus]